MAMTGVVKDELSRVPVTKPCCRKAEVSTLLRFAGGLTLNAGHIVIEAELDTAAVARRLRAGIAELFGQTSELLVLAPGGLRKGSRYVVRVTKGGDSLARQAGLIDSFGRPVRGLPKQVVAGGSCDCEAAWRARLSPPLLTRTTYRLPLRKPPGASTSSSEACPNSSASPARSRRATAAVSSSASIMMCPAFRVSPPANRSMVATSAFRQHDFVTGIRLSSSFTTPVIAISAPP